MSMFEQIVLENIGFIAKTWILAKICISMTKIFWPKESDFWLEFRFFDEEFRFDEVWQMKNVCVRMIRILFIKLLFSAHDPPIALSSVDK